MSCFAPSFAPYANIYQGFILNLGLNHMQYAVFTNNQTKNMWFVPLIRNMNRAITYIYVHEKVILFMTSTSMV